MIWWIFLFAMQTCMLHSLPLNSADDNLKNDPLTKGEQPPPALPSATKNTDEFITAPLHSPKQAIDEPGNQKLRKIVESYSPGSSNSSSSKSERQWSAEPSEMIPGGSVAIPFDPLTDHTFFGGPPARPPRPPIHVTIPPDVEIINTGRPIQQTVFPQFTHHPPQFVPSINADPLVSYRSKESAIETKNKTEVSDPQLLEKSSSSSNSNNSTSNSTNSSSNSSRDSTIGIFQAGSNKIALRVTYDESGKSRLCFYEVTDYLIDESKNRTCIHFNKPGEQTITKNDSRILPPQGPAESDKSDVTYDRNSSIAATILDTTSSKPNTQDSMAKTEKLVWEVKNVESSGLTSAKLISNETPETNGTATAPVQNSTPVPSSEFKKLDWKPKNADLGEVASGKPVSNETFPSSTVSQNLTTKDEQNSFPTNVTEPPARPNVTDNQNNKVIAENSKSNQTDQVDATGEKPGKGRSNDANEDDVTMERSADTRSTIENLHTTPSTTATEHLPDLSNSERKSTLEEKTESVETISDSKLESMVLDLVNNLAHEINHQGPEYVYSDFRKQDNEQIQPIIARSVYLQPYDYDVSPVDTMFGERAASNSEDYSEEPTYFVPILYTE